MNFPIKEIGYKRLRPYFYNIRSLIFILSFFSIVVGNSQNISSNFKKSTDSLIKAAPKTYQELDTVLKPYRRDTLYMNYFVLEAAKKKYWIGESYALNQLGIRARNRSQFALALNLHKKALEAASQGESLEFKVLSLNMLGVVYRRTDAIKTALDYNKEALELAESVEDPSDGLKRSINVSLNSIGNLYLLLKQYDLAISQFKKSLKLEENLGNKLGMAINYQNIGEALEEQGKLDEAMENYRTALAYDEKLGSARGQAICKNSIAQIYIKQGNSNEALKILEPTLQESKSIGDKSITSWIEINIGWALMQQKHYKEAEQHLLTGLSLAQRYNLPRSISQAYVLLSEVAEKSGNPKSALDYYKLASQFEEEISNERNLRYVNDIIMRYDSEKKNNQIQMLAKENELVKVRLRKNNTILLICGIALALLAGIFYILYRQHHLKNEKKLLSLEQTMLRSQMNPHFLFNSLNSIKLYIINNEKKNAVHYLNKFAKLVRKILEASSLKEISLAEELETVELYMNIENIRFSNEINFLILIDNDIDVNTVKIPSLILQPFLENALWHGLSSKEGEKNIQLHVSRQNERFINIAIIDNGVGREASERIKETKVLKRKSIGIDITKERLANFSKDYQNSFTINFEDLYDEARIAIGTQVNLHIPTV